MTARPQPPTSSAPSAEVLARLVGAGVASRIGAGDTTLWPGAARPGWVGAARAARPLVGEIEGLRDQLRAAGQVRVMLAAAGGVGVAAEALCGAEPRLVVLDSTDPVQVTDALAGDLAATVLVVSAPPGEDTTDVELLRDVVHRAFRAEGLDPAAHTVVVTPPDGPLLQRAGGSIVVLGPADVDGPWAALTAFALVPAGLAGVDVRAVLADAAATGPDIAADAEDNAALRLGALLAGAPVVALAGERSPAPTEWPALTEWAAQLVAGGLGKDGRGPVVVPVEGADAPEWAAALPLSAGPVRDTVAGTTGSPAAQILQWQYAVAVAAHLLGVDPTDRPDALAASGDPGPTAEEPAFVDGAIEVHAGPWLPAGTVTVADALRALTGASPDRRSPVARSGCTHLTVHAYLDRGDDASAAVLRPELARRTGLPTFFGWAPRCLPGSGQRDKGGARGAVVCQLTGVPDGGDGVPGDVGGDPLAERQLARARADELALSARGTNVLRLHFTDRVAGLVTLARAVQQL